MIIKFCYYIVCMTVLLSILYSYFNIFSITTLRSTSCYFVLTLRGTKGIHHQNHMVNLCNIIINFEMFLNNYHYILLSYAWASQNKYLWYYLFVCNFNYATSKLCTIFKYYLPLSNPCPAPTSALSPVIIIVLSTSTNASLYSHRLDLVILVVNLIWFSAL